jgi:formylglycine-generating enzyme required for sulfatase activity
MAPAAHTERVFRDCPTCPVMVEIPGGSFIIGLNASDPAARPARKVAIAVFAIGQSPVTVAEWKVCQADGGCGDPPRMRAPYDDAPLYNASFDDAQQYVTWLSKVTQQSYRLPSESEWEYAARAGTLTAYPWGDAIGTGHADCNDCGGPRDPRGPAPVQRYAPNPFGLYGMGGGVAQWTADCWYPNYTVIPTDGAPHLAPGCAQRVLRGGSYLTKHDEITPVFRNRYDSPVRYPANGFRVARDLEPAD